MVSGFDSVVNRENWDQYESRIERNTHRLIHMLSEFKAPRLGRSSEGLPITDGDRQPCADQSRPPDSDWKAKSKDSAQGIKATFFCLGWLAERYPKLIREIWKQGHEIACHGYNHLLIYKMTPEQFREDVRRSKKILEDLIGEEVIGYRAPSYSITKDSVWALKILAEEGYRYDSSIFPIRHDRYGIPDAPRFPFKILFDNGNLPFRLSPSFEADHQALKLQPCSPAAPADETSPASGLFLRGLHPIPSAGPSPCTLRPAPCDLSLLEVPASTVRLFNVNFPVSGGGYFRLFPYRMIRNTLRRINREENLPFLFYLHPWEMDAEQPRIQGAMIRSRFRHYINLSKTEKKFKMLLGDFHFSPIREVMRQYGTLPQQPRMVSGKRILSFGNP